MPWPECEFAITVQLPIESSKAAEIPFTCGCEAIILDNFVILSFKPVCDEMIWRLKGDDVTQPSYARYVINHLARQVAEIGSGEPLYAPALKALERIDAEAEAEHKRELKTKSGAINYAVLHDKRIAHWRWGTVWVSPYGKYVAFAWKAWGLVIVLVVVVAMIEHACNVLK
jgi:hypothetical protein